MYHPYPAVSGDNRLSGILTKYDKRKVSMKHYELLYLISGQVPETQLEKTRTEVIELISNVSGIITRKEAWGRKKLAYQIRDDKYGYYSLVEFDAEPEKISELERKLKLHQLIARHMLLIYKPLSVKELMMQERAQKRAQARAAAQDEVIEKIKTGPESAVSKPEKEASKIRLDELDKKLDELLDQDIVK